MIGSTAETARKRPAERPWTAARTMEMLRRCPLAIAQRLVHCAIALSTAVLDRVTKTMSVAPLLTTTWTTRSKRRPTCSAQLHLPTHDLFWAKVRVQLHLPPLRSLDLAWNPDAAVRSFVLFLLNVLRCQKQQHTTFKTLDNWAIKPPPNQKGKGPERKG